MLGYLEIPELVIQLQHRGPSLLLCGRILVQTQDWELFKERVQMGVIGFLKWRCCFGGGNVRKWVDLKMYEHYRS